MINATPATMAAMMLALGGTALAQSVDDAPPSQPGNFRATLYSNAGGEIFWERATDDRGAVPGYEVTINGESRGILDALSLYDPSLQPDVPYVFTIVAIDNAGQRSTVATTTLGIDTMPPPPGDAPAAPAELRSAIYSPTAAELFWRRESSDLALRYEVLRDGESVAMTDGVSYFTDELAPGRDYTFEVIAIGLDGSRSAASTLMLRTDGDAGPPSPPPPPPLVVSGPPAPSGLRSSVYSATAGAIGWDRADVRGLRYEISRDGVVLTTTRGTSFVDNELASGTSYRYSVVAIDGDDGRSSPSTVTLTTLGRTATRIADVEQADPSAASLYGRLGAARAIELARLWLGGEQFELAEAAQGVITRVSAAFAESGPQAGEPATEIACLDSGSVRVSATGAENTLHDFSDCVESGLRLDGVATRGRVMSSDESGVTVSDFFGYGELSVSDPEDGTELLASGRIAMTAGTGASTREFSNTTHTRDDASTLYIDYVSNIDPDSASEPRNISAHVMSDAVENQVVRVTESVSTADIQTLRVIFANGDNLRLTTRLNADVNARLDVTSDGSNRSYLVDRDN